MFKVSIRFLKQLFGKKQKKVLKYINSGNCQTIFSNIKIYLMLTKCSIFWGKKRASDKHRMEIVQQLDILGSQQKEKTL